MSKYSSKYWGPILEAKPIEYGHQTRNVKQMVRKVLNTILAAIAYRCPSNKLRIQLHRWRGCHIGDNCYLGQFCVLDNLAPEYIYMEDWSNVNAGCMILTHFNPAPRFEHVFSAEVKPVVIKSNSMVAVRCTIMPGVTVGEFAMVSAGLVIDHNIPDYNLYAVAAKPKMVNLKKVIMRGLEKK